MEKVFLAVFAFGLLVFAGCVAEPAEPVTPPVTPEPEPEPEPEPQPEPEETLTMEEAKAIAQSSQCMEKGSLTDTYVYNDVTKTWWFDMDIVKEGCAPACVVDEETKTAEINWRCTGLLPENETEGHDHYCTEEEKNADVCTQQYDPVCADNGVTYSNGCVACATGEVEYYDMGECTSNNCQLVYDAGPCEAEITKYYFDNIDQKCKEFMWGGCEGVVPFDTMEECQIQCEGKTQGELNTEEKCSAAGGTWNTDDKGVARCLIQTSDAGKSCTSSDQCESYCTATAPFATSGICYSYTTLSGCWYVLEDGKASEVCN